MIPGFHSGVLPPFIGNVATSSTRSPYLATTQELVATFATSAVRCQILDGFLRYRAQVHALGFTDGFQWVDGSFVENKPPKDIDIVTFAKRPPSAQTVPALQALRNQHPTIFKAQQSKPAFMCDAYWVDLDSSTGSVLVEDVSYWLGLFSHQRTSFMWKGLVQLELNTPGDDAAALIDLQKADEKCQTMATANS